MANLEFINSALSSPETSMYTESLSSELHGNNGSYIRGGIRLIQVSVNLARVSTMGANRAIEVRVSMRCQHEVNSRTFFELLG